jgi:hypothetical protein
VKGRGVEGQDREGVSQLTVQSDENNMGLDLYQMIDDG